MRFDDKKKPKVPAIPDRWSEPIGFSGGGLNVVQEDAPEYIPTIIDPDLDDEADEGGDDAGE